MKLKRKTTSKTAFFAGIIACILFTQLILPAAAALVGKTVEVFTGVTVYVNNERVQMKDANGNPVEAFIYNGTTYLPARAISTSFGLPIRYEAATTSVYVGSQNWEYPDVWLDEVDYFFSSKAEYRMNQETAKDNLGNVYHRAIEGGLNQTYRINGQYSCLAGTLYQMYEERSSTRESTFKVYADRDLVYSATIKGGLDPIEFDIPLYGVIELKVEFDGGFMGFNSHFYAALGNCGFYLA